jgi:hypothetical protein
MLCLAVHAVLVGQVIACGVPVSGSGEGSGKCSVSSDRPDDDLNIQANNPHRSKNTPTEIVGKGTIRCTVAATNVTLFVRLEKRSADGRWSPAVSPNNAEFIGAVVPGKKYTVQDEIACEAGTFRTAARGEGTLGGSRSASVAWTYSQVVTNPCES